MVLTNTFASSFSSGMWLHLNNPSLSQVGLATLCNVTIKLESNEVSRISEDDLEVILQTMLVHRNTKVVQSNAIQALKNFTFSQSNLEVLGNNKHLVDVVLAARSVHREGFEGRDEKLLMSLPTWQQKTTSSNSSRTGLSVRSNIEMDNSLGKSWSDSSWPGSAAAASQSRPGTVAVPFGEVTPLKKGENALQARYNSEHGSAGSHSGTSYSTDESRPGAVSVTIGNNLLDERMKKKSEQGSTDSHSGTSCSRDDSRPGAVSIVSRNSLLDRRMKKKSEQASVISQPASQGSASASSSQGGGLLDERKAAKEKEEASFIGRTSEPGATLVPNDSALDRRMQAKQRKGLLGKIRGR